MRRYQRRASAQSRLDGRGEIEKYGGLRFTPCEAEQSAESP